MAVDMQVPIGKGQELILGDQKTGKSTLQFKQLPIKFGPAQFVSTSRSVRKVRFKFVQKSLQEMDVLKSTVIISASASDQAPLIYLSPLPDCPWLNFSAIGDK